MKSTQNELATKAQVDAFMSGYATGNRNTTRDDARAYAFARFTGRTLQRTLQRIDERLGDGDSVHLNRAPIVMGASVTMRSRTRSMGGTVYRPQPKVNHRGYVRT